MAQQKYAVTADVGRKKPVKHSVICQGEPHLHEAEIKAALAPDYRVVPLQITLISVSPELPKPPRKGGQKGGGDPASTGGNVTDPPAGDPPAGDPPSGTQGDGKPTA